MMVQIASRATSRVSAPVIFVSLGLSYGRHSGMVRRTRPGISRFPDVQLHI